MPIVLALYVVAFILSIIIHEVMHGLVALKFGDRTALNAGRLTLNPIPHIDLFGSILLPGLLIFSAAQGLNPGFIIGWAKPVPINPLNFSNIRRGELMVAAAGVAANFGIAIVASLLLHSFKIIGVQSPLLMLFPAIGQLNLLLGVFNLFPIPPLDGSRVLMSQLPYNLAKSYSRLEPYGILILLVFMMIPFGRSSLLQTILGFFVGLFSGILGF